MNRLGRAEILRLIPHQGAMCLLDEVLDWNELSATCLSRRYGAPTNPMRRADGVLGLACGIEIAAQAMAVQGRLASGAAGAPTPGYLAGLRDVTLHGKSLDAMEGDLMIEVERLMGDAKGAIYRFALAIQNTTRLAGRATVLFGATR